MKLVSLRKGHCANTCKSDEADDIDYEELQYDRCHTEDHYDCRPKELCQSEDHDAS